MRICLLTHNLREDNGGGVFSRRLIEGFKKKLGAEVIAFTTVASDVPFEKAILSPNIVKLFSALFRVRRAIKTCDVVHAMDAYPYGIIAALATLGLKKKIVITAVGTGSVQLLYHRHFLLTRLVEWSYARAVAITAISRFTRDLILARLPHLHVQVITPGVDYEKFGAANDGERKLLGDTIVEDSKGVRHAVRSLNPYLLSVGSIRWRKGYKRSLKAFAWVHEQFPHLRYVIVGKRYSEKFYQELLRIIRDLGLTQSVFIFDHIDTGDALRALYVHAELFCLLSQNFGHDIEGFGMVFLEAAAAGLPVVGSKGNGIEDAMVEGKNGFLVHWQDEKGELAERIMTILNNSLLREHMRQASREWAKNSGWDSKMDAYRALYQKLVRETQSASQND